MRRARNLRIAAAAGCAALALLAAASRRRRRAAPAAGGPTRESFLADRLARMRAARGDLLVLPEDVAS